MSVTFRAAVAGDLPAILALLRDDILGATREDADADRYRAGFDAIAAEPHNAVIVGTRSGRIVATYQLTLISGLALRAARRAQIEGVRVAADLRGQGLGTALVADAEARARAAGCALLQLTMNRGRGDAHRFYEAAGFEASHIGFKRVL